MRCRFGRSRKGSQRTYREVDPRAVVAAVAGVGRQPRQVEVLRQDALDVRVRRGAVEAEDRRRHAVALARLAHQPRELRAPICDTDDITKRRADQRTTIALDFFRSFLFLLLRVIRRLAILQFLHKILQIFGGLVLGCIETDFF